VEAYPQGVFRHRNLTSDPETGLGHWTEGPDCRGHPQWGRRPLGRSISGACVDVSAQPAEDDALAIASYLKTLPPVRNQIPAPLHYGVIETIVSKLTRPLPRGSSDRAHATPTGNFGATTPGPPRDLPQRVLIGGQWVVPLGEPSPSSWRAPERRSPTGRGWLLTALAVFGSSSVG